ncbi:CDP-diacylglycerol--glycerol-3-phosphate 3-phosphatidyltransferase [Treponema parvum]|uniref:CDP-diacylglycerol--glycerol-3-phosphate 3-phosphatidyltransferase n=1 Tax=Treponema parvum TaxID=138851 RepID=A0A975IDU0_9SPIR|nr:CDP-diacylglycerol--glycerol-3-phosphate 3-phosphatidyltransferase [Treponema parvum]QTQ13350.1 CDP-diacylglycerol--glycerol-3-phosphate 3-phosphatidyltransferase [Treponema parvum]
MNLSDKFTLCRVIGAPVFFLLYFIPVWTGYFSYASVFVIIPLIAFLEFTDFLDGFFARKNNQVSDFGKLFDPFADVILHLTTFSCFMLRGISGVAYLPSIIFVFIMYREFSMNFIRMIAAKKGIAIAARKGGKLKTVLYVVSGFFALAVECCARLGLDIENSLMLLKSISGGLFVLCLVASYVSFADYLIHFRKVFKKSDNKA